MGFVSCRSFALCWPVLFSPFRLLQGVLCAMLLLCKADDQTC